MQRTTLLLASLLAVSTPTAALSQSASAPAETSSSSEDLSQMTAAQFVERAASGNTLEVESSTAAQEQADDPEVKAFAEQLIEDHTDALAKLMAAAETEGVPHNSGTTAVTMLPQHVKMLDMLSAETGEAFSAEYLQLQVQAHEDAIALHEAYVEHGADGALKDYAETVLPSLQNHLEKAQSLAGT